MSQFKKPSSCIDQSSKFPSVPKFSMDESVIEHHNTGLAKREESSRQHAPDQHGTVGIQGTELSAIMEATREYNRYETFQCQVMFIRQKQIKFELMVSILSVNRGLVLQDSQQGPILQPTQQTTTLCTIITTHHINPLLQKGVQYPLNQDF